MTIPVEINLYVAGLFDGEGWFSINRVKSTSSKISTREYRYQAYAALAVKQKYIVEFLRENYGGFVYCNKGKKNNHNDSWRWVVTGTALRLFILNIAPYLKIKHEQATLVYTLCILKENTGNKSITDENYKLNQDIFNKLKELNKRGK